MNAKPDPRTSEGLTGRFQRKSIQGVFLDVDGVLLDSLPQHLAICTDKAREFGLNLDIPDVVTFRRMVLTGIKISPMLDFFIAVGFPKTYAKRAVVDYERDFMHLYRPYLFPGVDLMLARLRSAGYVLGLVTANTARNVEPALGVAMRHFEPRLLFYVDTFEQPRSKSWCLSEGALRMRMPVQDCIFVGDQPADARAALESGCQFLGVTYGWGLVEGNSSIVTVGSAEAIADALIERGH